MRPTRWTQTLALAALLAAAPLAQDRGPSTTLPPDDARVQRFKSQAAEDVDAMATFTQQMVDQIFSYGELGFQEVETHRYLVDVLKKNGFTVQEGIAGIPTAFMATWGSGKPVLALGSDIDGIPQASQKPGVAYHAPLIDGAPGHGEGHNSGQAVNITAALAVKKVMEREKLPGTIRIWPGTAEELVATKAYFVREGFFKDVDVALFTHVGNDLAVSWGDREGTGLVSVEYTFRGQTAHSAGAPWRGRSALDAVELMNIGWNYRREHLPLEHRSHYVVTNGGDQPNVVPRTASVWYYFRQTTYPRIKELWELGDQIARGAAMMSGTELLPSRVLGSAWPQHPEGGDAAVERSGSDARARAAEGAGQPRAGAEHESRRTAAGSRHGEPRRRFRRHRRHLLERADGHAAVSVEHSGAARPQLGERHRDGNADRAQRSDRRRARAGDDDDRSADEAGARGAGVGLLQERADEIDEVRAPHPRRGQARHPPEPRDYGEVPAGDAEVLLRSVAVQDVSRAAGDRVSDVEEGESVIPHP
jgi:amidohydrolase